MTVNNNISSLNTNNLKKISQSDTENIKTKSANSLNANSASVSGAASAAKTASNTSASDSSSKTAEAAIIEDTVTISAAGETALANSIVSSTGSKSSTSSSQSTSSATSKSGGGSPAPAPAPAAAASSDDDDTELATLTAKVYSGVTLTASELETLRTEAPYLYALATQSEQTGEESEDDSSNLSEIQKENENQALQNNGYNSIPGFYGSEDYSTPAAALGSINVNTTGVSLYI